MKTNYRNEATVQHKIRQLNILTIRVTNILVADFNLHHLHLVHLVGGNQPLSNFKVIFWHRKTSPWAIEWHCLCYPTFSHFSKTPR